MTSLNDDDRAALIGDIRKNILMCVDIDREFWELLLLAIEDSAALEGAIDSIAEHQEICACLTGERDAALERVKALETQLANLAHVSSARRDAKRFAEKRAKNAEYRLEHLTKDGIWVRATTYHEDRESNASYFCGEYNHPFVVEAFDCDPGEYDHSGGVPGQFRVKVPIRALLEKDVK